MTTTDLHALLGTRWALPVLQALVAAPLRFNELRRACPGVSARMLMSTLRALFRSDATLVVWVEEGYTITDRGRQVLAWSNLLPVTPAEKWANFNPPKLPEQDKLDSAIARLESMTPEDVARTIADSECNLLLPVTE